MENPFRDPPPRSPTVAPSPALDPNVALMTGQAPLQGNEEHHRLAFTGQWKEYFRIWIVNTFLTVATLGFFSPWARIRKRKWFLGHTWALGQNFDFHANPWPIFRGRLIAGVIFVLYWFFGEMNPKYATWLALGIAVAAPFLVISTLRFNLSNTSYRNLRFGSLATLSDAVWAMWPLVGAALVAALAAVYFPDNIDIFDGKEPKNQRALAALMALIPASVFALAYPFVHGKMRLLALDKSKFGSEAIHCTARVGSFYSAHIRGAAIGFGVFIIAGIVGVAIITPMTTALSRPTQTQIFLLTSLFISLYVFASLIWYAAIQTRLINLTFNLTTVGHNVRVLSDIRTIPMAKMYFLNTLLIIITAGLAIPWAAVRTAKQRVETTSLAITGNVDHALASLSDSGNTAADAATDFFSLDVSL